MDDKTSWTPGPEDSKLGLSDKNLINELEAKGIAAAELYEWAAMWRTNQVVVGQLTPPDPVQVLQFMYQFIDNLNFKAGIATNSQDHLDTLTFAHYEFVRIHSFNNGNGRTGRILMNLVAMKFGYRPLELYHREGDGRKIYIDAMKSADKGDFRPLRNLIGKELTTF
jgi:cell filamentation protein